MARSTRTLQSAEKTWNELFGTEKLNCQNPLGHTVVLLRGRLLDKLGKDTVSKDNKIARAKYLPYLKQIITQPDEIHKSWSDKDDAYRYIYVKECCRKDNKIILVCVAGKSSDNNEIGVFTIYKSDRNYVKKMNDRIYVSEEKGMA